MELMAFFTDLMLQIETAASLAKPFVCILPDILLQSVNITGFTIPLNPVTTGTLSPAVYRL